MPFSQPRQRLIIAAILVLLPLLYFYPAVLGQVLLAPGDGWTQIFGLRVLIGQMIAHGQLPLWDPYLFAGMPLLASIQVGALYPPTWLFAFLPSGIAMNVMVITTYHLALIGAYLYARRIGANQMGALVTAIAFAFGGFLLAHLGHTNRIAAAAWLPWILLAIEQLCQQATWRWTVAGALFVTLQLLAGDPQMTAYTIFVGGMYAGFSLLLRIPRSNWIRFVAAGLTLAVLSVLLSAIQLLPERELLQQGERAQIAYEYFSAYSMPPRQVLALIFPYFFGGAFTSPYTITYWGQWSIGETCAYVGILGLLLTFIALFARWQERLVWFWSGTAIISLGLCFGSYLPFELYRLFYRLPVYNLFRAPARNRLEFTFALAVLAGLGLTSLSTMPRDLIKRALTRSTILITVVMALTTLAYRLGSPWLVADVPPPLHATSLANWEAIFPLTFFVLSVLVCWFHAGRKSLLTGSLVVLVLLGDLSVFGQFFQWRLFPYNTTAQMADPPTVNFIKSREADLNAFRIYSLALSSYDANYWMLNYPNVSAVRGLQSVNGYDPLRLNRLGEVAGDMRLDGIAQDPKVFGLAHRGLDILNAKYLLYERPVNLKESGTLIVYDGVPFHNDPLSIKLDPGEKLLTNLNPVLASELALVSTLGNALHLPDNTPVAKIILRAQNKPLAEYEILAGRDTAEWAIDRPDARALAKHRRARIAESWQVSSPAGAFDGHRYLTRIPFNRAEVTSLEIHSLSKEGAFFITRATFLDAATDNAIPLDPVSLPPERWHKLASYEQVDVYENAKLLPRAWFVNSLRVQPRVEVLQAIKTGALADGTTFDPARIALLETEDFGGQTPLLPTVSSSSSQQAIVTDYRSHSITVATKNPAAGFLLLSEIYARDWEARVDGKKTPIFRADYLLRGIAVPAGDHQIEFFFRGPAFRNGAIYSALGVLLVLLGTIFRLLIKWRRHGNAALPLT